MSDYNEDSAPCLLCGDPIDYCQGHGYADAYCPECRDDRAFCHNLH